MSTTDVQVGATTFKFLGDLPAGPVDVRWPTLRGDAGVIVLRILVAGLAVVALFGTFLSILRTVVLPRGVPARLARVTFLGVRSVLLLRLRIGRHRHDYATRDRVLALQGPLGIFGQLLLWSSLLLICFAALFWSMTEAGGVLHSIAHSFELSGSSMLTLGTDAPHGLWAQSLSFAAAGVGLVLLALVITYLPSLYGAFSQREALISKLVVRAGAPPTGARLLARTWELERFDYLDEVWESWENWFVELGESHTTFPLLGFFRSSHPNNHWVLATEAVLDGASLMLTTVDVPRQSRSELAVEAGVQALRVIADFLGIPGAPPDDEPEITLARSTFDAGCEELIARGVPMHSDRDKAWKNFRRARGRYEPLLTQLGRMTDAPRSDWSAWSDDIPLHRPPVLRIHNT